MIKLKEVVAKLDNESYKNIEGNLKKTKADNFLFLMQAYRSNNISDNEIIQKLNLNSNSFYVLKSRLYDKIQSHIAGNFTLDTQHIAKQLQQIPEMCYNAPREIALAFLHKLEKELLEFDLHAELLQVYSAFKKLHFNSDRYFHFSQQYNKHIAFAMSVEKAEDLLSNFTRILMQYDFSKSKQLVEKLLFLRKEILDNFALNPSRQIEIIKNLVELQIGIFCGEKIISGLDIGETLDTTRKKIDELPGSDYHRKWSSALDYLYFEYYLKTSPAKAQYFFDKLDQNFPSLLLYNNVALTARFLMSRIQYLQEQNRTEELLSDTRELYIDPHDMYTKVMHGLYNAMLAYYKGKQKEAISILNDVINIYSFKDYFHINMEIRLTLAFFYIHMKDNAMAETILKSIYRKLKTDNLSHYENAFDIIKVFTNDIASEGTRKIPAKQKDTFTLFIARNTSQYELLRHLQQELKKRYLAN
jgi:hypothetical protein